MTSAACVGVGAQLGALSCAWSPHARALHAPGQHLAVRQASETRLWMGAGSAGADGVCMDPWSTGVMLTA